MTRMKQFLTQLASFEEMRDSYFDVTAENAIEIILSDQKKTKEDREEDAEFVRRLRKNQFVKFGIRDWEQQERFDRAAKREQELRDREAREKKRKLVSKLPCKKYF